MLGWLHILFMLVQLGMMVEICFWERCWEKYPTYDAWTGYANGLTTYAAWNYACAGKADGTETGIEAGNEEAGSITAFGNAVLGTEEAGNKGSTGA